jgi:hypothetical protein
MKNTLSENMMRFGTKNLSEGAQKELVLKSIMETINQHGLHGAVRKRLTEGDIPTNPKAEVGEVMSDLPYKKSNEFDAMVYVIQSPTSLKEASEILSGMMRAIGTDNAEGTMMVNLIKRITPNNYPAILWKVKYSSSFKAGNSKKKNFQDLSSWLMQYLDKPTTGRSAYGAGGRDSDIEGQSGIIGSARDWVLGVKTAQIYNSKMSRINNIDLINTADLGG